jgi:hypothetical protein
MPAATAAVSAAIQNVASPSINMSAADLFHYDSLTPSLVGTSTADFSNNTGGTLTLPAGIVEGDCIVLYVASDGAAPTMVSTGWTAINNGNPSTHFFAAWQKIMGATPDVSVEISGVNTASSAIARAYRGTSGVAVNSIASSTTGMPNNPSITPSVLNSVVVIFGSLDDDAAITSSAPTTFGNYVSIESAAGKVTLYSADRFNVSSAVDPASWAGSGSDEWGAITLSLSPATKKTLSFTNVPSQAVTGYGTLNSSVKVISVKGSIGVNFPASVTFVNLAPTVFPCIVSLITFDGGTTWTGVHAP